MVIPVSGIQGDKSHSGFHQSSSKQCLFTPAGAILLSNFWILFFQIERISSPPAQDDVLSLLVHVVEVFEGSGLIELPTHTIKLVEQ